MTLFFLIFVVRDLKFNKILRIKTFMFLDEPRIVHDYENLLFLSKTQLSRALPVNWSYICDKMPSIVRQEVNNL